MVFSSIFKPGSPRGRTTNLAVLKALKEQGITTFGTTGYRFGAKNVLELAIEGEIAAGAMAHPSRLRIPIDLERLAASGSKAKILINSCDIDSFSPEAQAKADGLLGDGKHQAGYKSLHWEGRSHRFAIRDDLSDPKVQAGKGAFKAAIEHFQSALDDNIFGANKCIPSQTKYGFLRQ